MYFRSKSNQQHFIAYDIAQSWGIFRDALEYKEGEVLDVDLDDASFLLVLEYYSKIKVETAIPKPLPLKAAYVMDFRDALGYELRNECAWIDAVAVQSKNRILLWKLFETCNFLHAQRLLDLCSARIAFQYKNMTVWEMRESLRIK